MNEKMKKLKQIECEPKCGFLVRSHDENEVIDIAMKHAKQMHPEMKVSKNNLKDMIKNV